MQAEEAQQVQHKPTLKEPVAQFGQYSERKPCDKITMGGLMDTSKSQFSYRNINKSGVPDNIREER